MHKEPLVSVVVRSYNQKPAFLEESLRSVLNQTYQNVELIIADDSTAEASIKTMDELAKEDKRVTIIRKPERMGLANSFNEAFNVCKGEYIVLLDDDDVSYLDRIENQLQYSEEHPEMDVFGGDIDIVDENGTIKSERCYPTTPNSIKKMFIFRSPFAQPTIMFKRRIIDDGMRYNAEYKRAEDLEFFLRLYKKGYQFGNIGKKVLKYRVCGDLQNKRRRDQWVSGHKARTENFDWSKPFFSTASWFVSLLYMCVPSFVVSKYYKHENKG